VPSLAGAPFVKDLALVDVLALDPTDLFMRRLTVGDIHARARALRVGSFRRAFGLVTAPAVTMAHAVDVFMALALGVLFLELRTVSACAVSLSGGPGFTYHL
jgi:hypothetical protein